MESSYEYECTRRVRSCTDRSGAPFRRGATLPDTSPAPVRFALYRLAGEGLVADHARDGLHVPLLNEVALRNLYDWMERLLLMACDIGEAPTFQKTGNWSSRPLTAIW
jgi:hypothetical protein